jgi:hypothetical protein
VRCVRLWALVIIVQLLPGSAVNAQQTQLQPGAPGDQKATTVSPLAQKILDLVASVPPELAAYAQLRLVETNAISARGRKIELIESAFTLAQQSPYPVRKSFAYGNVDSRAGYLSYSYDLKLDTLSLQAESVRAMLQIDPERARGLFAEMGPVKLDVLACSDVLVYSPSAYYEAAGEVFRKGFNRDEQERGMDADFLVSILQAVSHASETNAAADLLLSLKLEPNLSARVEGAFGRALSTISGDRRSFDQTQNVLLIDLFRLTKDPAPAHRALLSGSRAYLVANYSGEACADSTAAPSRVRADGTITSSPQEPFPELDNLFRPYGIAPIHFSDLVSSSHGDRAQNETLYWKSQPAHQFEKEEGALISPTNSKLLPEWQARAEAFLTELRGWTDTSTEPTEDDFYIEKSSLYSGLLRATPVQSPVFPDAVGDFAAFLATPPQSDAVRVFWLSNLNFLRARMKSSDAKTVLEAALQRTPNPSIAIWGYLDALTDAHAHT